MYLIRPTLYEMGELEKVQSYVDLGQNITINKDNISDEKPNALKI